ncbi:MAG: DegT/DnrJ/EryC1/StrS family aminotransferase [Candidatus Aminicenantales bacterium]
MDIPFLDLKAQYQSLKDEIEAKILEVVSTQRFILGPEVEALEKELADYCGVKFGIGVSSGSDALLSSLMTLGLGPGDEVVTTPFTFFATAGAVARVGAKPVFCDIEEKSYNIDPARLAQLLKQQIEIKKNSRIKVLIPVHLYGQCAEMEPIMDLARRYNLFVIEDAAQAVGSEYLTSQGVKKAGSIGHLNVLSFFPSKNLGGYGDGGLVLTDNEVMASKLRMMRVHGSKDKYLYEFIGGNFRLDALQAAILRVKFRHLEDWLTKRKERANYYDRLFKESKLIEEGFVLSPQPIYKNSGINNYHTYHQYVIRAEERDRLQPFLKERGVSTAVYYPLPLHLQKCFSYLGYKAGDFPQSEKVATQVLALPIYPELTRSQQDYIVASIKDFYSKKRA